MKTLLALLVLLALAAALPQSAAAFRGCISDIGFEIEGCGIERGPNEPAAHCASNGAGGRSSGLRVAETNPRRSRRPPCVPLPASSR